MLFHNMTSRFSAKLKSFANLARPEYIKCLPVFVGTTVIMGGYTGLYFSVSGKDGNLKYAPLFIIGGISTGAIAGLIYPLFIPWGMYKFSKEFIGLE